MNFYNEIRAVPSGRLSPFLVLFGLGKGLQRLTRLIIGQIGSLAIEFHLPNGSIANYKSSSSMTNSQSFQLLKSFPNRKSAKKGELRPGQGPGSGNKLPLGRRTEAAKYARWAALAAAPEIGAARITP
jgi:hypothetical protein